jgi:hypothetical protein
MSRRGVLTHPTPGFMNRAARAERGLCHIHTKDTTEIRMGCIYRIVCHPTGRSYVGQTAYSHPFERYKQHQASAHRGEPGPLYDDMRTYDIRDFECICLCVVENSQLNELECYYAEQYNAYEWDGGYNTGECGGAPVRADMTDDRRIWIRRRAIYRNLKR